MQTTILNQKPSIFNQFLAEIRDKQIQKDSLRFRRNLERMGEVLAYEISKTLSSEEISVKTPLGIAKEIVPKNKLVVASILRAGLPMHQGLLNYFDRAENAFVSAYRKYNEDGEFDIHIEYSSSPSLDGKTLILCDPMLATGSSLELAYRALLLKGTPEKTIFASLIASQAGVTYINNMTKTENVEFWVGAIDEELNAKSYIVPGLGDAGDLAFGTKL